MVLLIASRLCSMLWPFEVFRQLRPFGEGVVADGTVEPLLLHGLRYCSFGGSLVRLRVSLVPCPRLLVRFDTIRFRIFLLGPFTIVA